MSIFLVSCTAFGNFKIDWGPRHLREIYIPLSVGYKCCKVSGEVKFLSTFERRHLNALVHLSEFVCQELQEILLWILGFKKFKLKNIKLGQLKQSDERIINVHSCNTMLYKCTFAVRLTITLTRNNILYAPNGKDHKFNCTYLSMENWRIRIIWIQSFTFDLTAVIKNCYENGNGVIKMINESIKYKYKWTCLLDQRIDKNIATTSVIKKELRSKNATTTVQTKKKG